MVTELGVSLPAHCGALTGGGEHVTHGCIIMPDSPHDIFEFVDMFRRVFLAVVSRQPRERHAGSTLSRLYGIG